jgi:hypothetical protein
MAYVIDYPESAFSKRLPGIDPSYNIIVSQDGSTNADSTITTGENTERYIPYYWEGGRVESFSIYVSTATGSAANIRLALYNSDGADGAPGSLVIDAGDVSALGTGLKTVAITDTYVAPGWYYTFLNLQDPMDATSVTVKGQSFAYGSVTPLGCSDLICITHATKSAAYGAAPATASTGLTSVATTKPIIGLGRV